MIDLTLCGDLKFIHLSATLDENNRFLSFDEAINQHLEKHKDWEYVDIKKLNGSEYLVVKRR